MSGMVPIAYIYVNSRWGHIEKYPDQPIGAHQYRFYVQNGTPQFIVRRNGDDLQYPSLYRFNVIDCIIGLRFDFKLTIRTCVLQDSASVFGWLATRTTGISTPQFGCVSQVDWSAWCWRRLLVTISTSAITITPCSTARRRLELSSQPLSSSSLPISVGELASMPMSNLSLPLAGGRGLEPALARRLVDADRYNVLQMFRLKLPSTIRQTRQCTRNELNC